jgi:protocatechuate 3,4-dioxygenase beta subunit
MLLILAAGALTAQTVEGYVFDALTHAPVTGALVSASLGGQPAVSRTDAGGHFSVPVPSNGFSASVEITRAGYLHAHRAVRGKPGEAGSGLRIDLVPTAVIAGKLTDEDGFPVEGAQVSALRYQIMFDGERKLQPAWSSVTQSDDLGEFRIFSLPAGRYCIRATASDLANWDRRYVPEYVPGVLEPTDESWIEVKAGEERSGVNLRFTKHQGVTVEGHLAMPTGVAPGRMQVSLRQDQFAMTGYSDALQMDGGTFRLAHVPPGTYKLRAQSAGFPPKAGDFLAEQQLQVGSGDVRDVVLAVREVKPVDISGTVVLDGGGVPGTMMITLFSNTSPNVTVRSNEQGAFNLNGLLPGHYSLLVMADYAQAATPGNPRGVNPYPVSAILDEKEVLPTGFDLDGTPPGPLRITLSTRMYFVAGKLLDQAGNPVSGAVVALDSGQPKGQCWIVTDGNGAFRLGLTSVGDFHIYVVTGQGGSQTDLLRDPNYLKAHEQDFAPVHIVEGRNAPLVLRLPAR